MKAIDLKIVRDLRTLRGQAIAIIFVIMAGVGTYVGMKSVMDTLQGTLDTYYREYRFADGFAPVRRAPEDLSLRLSLVPGISQLETRVSAGVNLEIEGFNDPVSGLIVSIPEDNQPVLNRLFLRSGRLVSPGREDEVILNEIFAGAHNLLPGDEITAIINGRRRVLSIAGIALSPEYLYLAGPGTLFPDPERYGMMWMGRNALASAYDMQGAFNHVSFTVAPGAVIEDVLDRVDQLLKPYGGSGAYARKDQQSHTMISEEFNQLRGMSSTLPLIFLAVAAFLLNIVISRLISLQREQIAILKAFGYSNVDIGLHYIKLVLVIALAGAVAGTLLGIWIGNAMADLYLEYFRFPYLEYTLRPGVFLSAIGLTTGAALAGVIFALRRAVKLAPAEAMRPEPPALYKQTVLERLGLQRFFDQPTRMILRNLERQPVKAMLTIAGISSSCAILIMGLVWEDIIDYIIYAQYGIAQREDVTVVFNEPTSTFAAYELVALPGVHHVEPFRFVPVKLRNGHRQYDIAIEGLPSDSYLKRSIDKNLKTVTIPQEGIVLTERLAEILDVRVGEQISIEVLEGSRRTRSVPVAGVSQQFIGLGSWMNLDALNRLTGDGSALSGALLMVDERYMQDLTQSLRDRPRVASMVSQDRAIKSYMDTAAEMLLVYTFILSLFAGVIAFGVVYNSARISLSERDRELASLRVLGFTKGEISYILLGELAVLVMLAIPLGFILGALAAIGSMEALQTDMYQFPVIFSRKTFAITAIVVIAATVISSLLLRRKINQLDLVKVLKTRE